MEIKNVKIVNIVKIEGVVGDGTDKNPVRRIAQYWDMNGIKIGEEVCHSLDMKDNASS